MTTKVLQVKINSKTHLVVRTSTGRKLFEIEMLGMVVSFAVPQYAEIKIAPTEGELNVPRR